MQVSIHLPYLLIYLFLSGPNACIFTLKEHVNELYDRVTSTFSKGKEVKDVYISELGQGPQIDN